MFFVIIFKFLSFAIVFFMFYNIFLVKCLIINKLSFFCRSFRNAFFALFIYVFVCCFCRRFVLVKLLKKLYLSGCICAKNVYNFICVK